MVGEWFWIDLEGLFILQTSILVNFILWSILLLFREKFGFEENDFFRLFPDHPHRAEYLKCLWEHPMVVVKTKISRCLYLSNLEICVFPCFSVFASENWPLLNPILNIRPNSTPNPRLNFISDPIQKVNIKSHTKSHTESHPQSYTRSR